MPPALDQLASHHLGVRVRIASTELGEESGARAPLSGTGSPGCRLTAGEQAQWEALAPGPRRRDWLLGRAALKQLLGAGTDTSALRFPHPRLSLTHAGGVAFAVQAPVGDVVGTGVDYEGARPADPRTARFFLRAGEQDAARDAANLLRLWTVKEALYKATPDNDDAVLLDYELADARCACGWATGPGGEAMRYFSAGAAGGVITVAVCLAGRREGRNAAV